MSEDRRRPVRISKDRYRIMTLEELLKYTQSKGYGYPLGYPWSRMYIAVSRKTGGSNHTFPRFRNPLILGGAMASPNDKRERFATQIYWTHKNGGYEVLERFIRRLKDEEWDGLDAPSKETNISIEDIKKEYARWLDVVTYPERESYTLEELGLE